MLKKWWYYLSVSFLTVLTVCLTAGVVHADGTYEVSHYGMQINVLKDGSANVTQKMNFTIDDDINGLYVIQDLATETGLKKSLENAQVSLKTKGKTYQLQASQSGQDKTYQLTQQAQQYRFKIYQKATDGQRLQVTLHYRVKHLIINYRDTAELNWRVVGNGWGSALDNVHVIIQLPQNLKQTQLQSWTHGPLDGQQLVQPKKGRVTLTVSENPANQFVESHLIFPTSVTPNNPNKIAKNKKATILAAEAKQAEVTNQRRKHRVLIRQILSGLVLLCAPITLLVLLGRIRKRLPTLRYPKRPLVHVYDLPTSDGPAVVKALLALPRLQKADSKSLTAAVLDLVATKHISLTPLQADPKKRKAKPNYLLTLLDETNLSESDEALVNLFFRIVGDKRQVTLARIEEYPKHKERLRFKIAYEKWQQSITKAVKTSTWLRDQALDALDFVKGIGLVLLFVAVIAVVGALLDAIAWWALLSIVLAGVIVVWYLQRLSILTQTGFQNRQDWRGFKQMLTDISQLDMAQVSDVLLWDRYLSYATAFGVSRAVAKAVEIHLTPEQIETMPLGNFYFYGGVMAGNNSLGFEAALQSSLNSAFTSANITSTTGGSGGFSGGSSGGFGGGSGGGTF